jgi:uncharacterized protein
MRGICHQAGEKLTYKQISADYQSSQIREALRLLTLAGIVTPVVATSGNGIPLDAEADEKNMKVLFLDPGLLLAVLQLEGEKLTARNVKIIREIAERTEAIERGVEALVDARKVANKIESEREKAVAYHDTVAPKMEEIRYQIDKLELLVADELWTLPKYRELLFIR